MSPKVSKGAKNSGCHFHMSANPAVAGLFDSNQ